NSEVDPPVWATVQNDDPGSPLWVGHGFVYSDTVQSDTVTTTDACRELAKTILAERSALMESVDVVHRPRPEVDPLQLIAVTEADTGTRGTWQIASWDLDLEPGSMQRIVASGRRI